MQRITLLVLSVVTLVRALTFTVDPEQAIYTTNEKFLSVALDSSSIDGRFSEFNLTDPYLTKLVSNLSPMYFRVGGTFADRIAFSTNGTDPDAALTFFSEDYDQLYKFTESANVRLLFDLNSLLRNDDGSWNSENAVEMIEYSSKNSYELDWELGNEPDLYSSIYNAHVDASQLAKDFVTLRGILDQYELYKNSSLVGIDLFDVGGSQSNRDYLSTFLEGANDVIDAVTWHQYYFAGRDATEELFLSPSTFNYLEQRANVVKNIVGDSNRIWMGETSSAYNGGAANMSDRYIATFLWLDKLGLGASLGLDVIVRQTIFASNYGLLDSSYVPNPDYWVSIIYKILINPKVLSVTNDGDSATNTVRMYAHCAHSLNGAVTVFGFNVNSEAATVNITGIPLNTTVSAYELIYEEDLYSQGILLNGVLLKVSSEGILPDFKVKSFQNTGSFTIDPYSIVFWVFKGANATACL